MTRPPDSGDQLDPDLVGIDRSLAEEVADVERSDHDLDEVLAAAASDVGTSGRSGPRSLPSIIPPSRRAKMSTRTFLSSQEPVVPVGGLAVAQDGGQARVGTDEEVIVDLARLPCRRSPWPRSRSRASAPCGTRRSSSWPPAGNRSSAPRGPRRPRAGTCRNGSGRGRNPCSG